MVKGFKKETRQWLAAGLLKVVDYFEISCAK
jgi:hypothetical protein